MLHTSRINTVLRFDATVYPRNSGVITPNSTFLEVCHWWIQTCLQLQTEIEGFLEHVFLCFNTGIHRPPDKLISKIDGQPARRLEPSPWTVCDSADVQSFTFNLSKALQRLKVKLCLLQQTSSIVRDWKVCQNLPWGSDTCYQLTLLVYTSRVLIVSSVVISWLLVSSSSDWSLDLLF